MNTLNVILIQFAVTILIAVLFLAYLRSHLKKVLVDLCGTEERAQFWTTFTNIVLLALPLISALGFTPSGDQQNWGIEIIHQLKSSLTNFMLGLVLIGSVLLFFSAISPNARKRDTSKEQPS